MAVMLPSHGAATDCSPLLHFLAPVHNRIYHTPVICPTLLMWADQDLAFLPQMFQARLPAALGGRHFFTAACSAVLLFPVLHLCLSVTSVHAP